MLEGKVIIVTGGTKGIGEGCVEVMSRYGAQVAFSARDAQAGARMEARWREAGRDVLYVPTDQCDPAQVQRMVDLTLERYGRLDGLVNNAGTHISKTVFEHTEQDWDLVIKTNLKGYFLFIKAALDHLVASKGAIVNMSSMVGLVGQSRATAYAATKGGIVAMTKSIALDLAPYGVRVNALCPGWIDTPLVEDWFQMQPDPEAARQYIYSVHPLGRIGTIYECGEAAAFLLSERASFITGIALEVDGAVTLGY